MNATMRGASAHAASARWRTMQLRLDPAGAQRGNQPTFIARSLARNAFFVAARKSYFNGESTLPHRSQRGLAPPSEGERRVRDPEPRCVGPEGSRRLITKRMDPAAVAMPAAREQTNAERPPSTFRRRSRPEAIRSVKRTLPRWSSDLRVHRIRVAPGIPSSNVASESPASAATWAR